MSIVSLVSSDGILTSKETEFLKPVSIFDKNYKLSKVDTLIANSDYENGIPVAYYTTELHLEQLNQYIYDHNLLREDMLDLFDEYSLPKPMPEDEFYNFHVDTNQAYLLLATAGTGKYIDC